jgi:hypothetical protein
VGVGAEQVVGGVAVLTGVEDRLAVDYRQEGLQLRSVPARSDRRVPQHQEARIQAPPDEGHRQDRPADSDQPLRRQLGEHRPDRYEHRQRRHDHQRLGLGVIAAEGE